MNNILMNFLNAAETDPAVTGGFDAELAFIICLVLGIVSFVLTVLLFFLFDIPRVYLIMTGKGARKTIKKMEEVNAETGRLRKVNEQYMLGSDVPITSEVGQTPSYDIKNTNTNPVAAASTSADDKTGGNMTTVLGQNETTILSNSETTVLTGEMVGGSVQKYTYSRKTNGKFDVTFNVMLTHSTEII